MPLLTHKLTAASFLQGGGEMGRLMRAHAWEQTPLGTPDGWPQSLRITLSIMLNSRFPMFLFWGQDLLCFYNDAFRPSLGNNGRHPNALGQEAALVWPEIWPTIHPMIDQVLSSGEAIWSENQLIPIYRNGATDDVYWTFSYSPIRDESGESAGVFVTCSETTNNVNALRQLTESNDQLAFAIEATELGIWDLNPITNQFIANNRLKDWFGLLPDEEVDLSLAISVMAERDRQRVSTAIERALQYESGGRYTIDYTIVHPHTKVERVVRAKGRAWFASDQTAYRFNGTLQDITETRRAQEILETSESRFRTLIEEAPVATCLLVGRELIIEIANESILTKWGKGKQILGKPISDVLPEFKEQSFLQILDNVYTTGKTYIATGTPVQFRNDGALKTAFFDFTYKPLLDAAGTVYAILVMSMDVTEQVLDRQTIEAAQASLAQTTQRLMMALDAGRLGSYDLELATGRMTCTPQCKADYGRNADAPFNFSDLMQTLVADDRSMLEQTLAEALATKTTYHAEYRVTWPDGSLHWIRSSGLPSYADDGTPLRMSGVSQDITAQRMMQTELEQQVGQRTQQLQTSVLDLQRSNDNLQQFAYVASHDLQEPLRKIQAFGDILQDQYANELGEGTDYLRRMQSAASRMSTLIRDLLAFSRISTQQEAATLVSLDEVLNAVLTDLDLTVQETGAVVETAPLPTVHGDAPQLRQLFQNLLSNALKFRQTDSAGALLPPRIQVTVQQLTNDELPDTARPSRPAAGYYRIDVTDHGIGFDDKYADRIFQVFQRLHGKSEFSGTGIGLAICQKVAANHGGTITVRSQPGQGATFSIYLPADGPAELPQPA